MIQQESQNVWGYGRGMARSVARVTFASEDPGPDPTDPTDPANYTTLGAMKFTRVGLGAWQVDLDVAGPTYLRYAAARILYSTSDDFQAHVTIDDSDPEVPFGSRLRVQVWDVNGGGVPADDAEDLQLDAALCIEVIVNQSGEPKYNTGPSLLALPPPPPIPPPVP
ncbi:MAG: hypothetical protein GY842_21970 [bacterium]|nr:hypothetical protein [bacterium]